MLYTIILLLTYLSDSYRVFVVVFWEQQTNILSELSEYFQLFCFLVFILNLIIPGVSFSAMEKSQYCDANFEKKNYNLSCKK